MTEQVKLSHLLILCWSRHRVCLRRDLMNGFFIGGVMARVFDEQKLLKLAIELTDLDPQANYNLKYDYYLNIGYIYKGTPQKVSETDVVITQMGLGELCIAIEALIYGIKRGKELANDK